ADDPSPARTFQGGDDGALHARDAGGAQASAEPARSVAQRDGYAAAGSDAERSHPSLSAGAILPPPGPAFVRQYRQAPAGAPRALARLAACRTAALGGHVTECGHCGDVRYRYHSCGDRHCPACGGSKRAAWLERRRAELLEVPYFHVVFTLPHQLSALVLG